MNHRNAIAVLLVASFQIIFNVSSVLTDHTVDDCSVVQCPKYPQLECPSDSLLKSWPSTEEEEGEEKNDDDVTVNPFEQLAAAGLIDELHPTTATFGTHQKITTFEPLTRQQHHLSKRSLGLSRKEKIKIVAGDFRQFYQFPFNDHQSQRLYKRDLASASPAAEAVKRCCPEFQCICKSCQPMANCTREHVAIEVIKALGLPGDCCPKFECIPPPNCARHEELQHSTYWRDECTKCECIKGHELCQQLCDNHRAIEDASKSNCFSNYLKRPILNGESWHEDDDCTDCRCKNGERRCVTNLCPPMECINPVKINGQCCKVCLTTEKPEPTPNSTISSTENHFLSTSSPSLPSSITTIDNVEKITTTITTTDRIQSFQQPDTTAIDVDSFNNSSNDEPSLPNETAKEIRNILWEIDWVVLIALIFIICAVTIGFLVNRSRENRKKIYLTIPNSELSSSQTSTIILNV